MKRSIKSVLKQPGLSGGASEINMLEWAKKNERGIAGSNIFRSPPLSESLKQALKVFPRRAVFYGRDALSGDAGTNLIEQT